MEDRFIVPELREEIIAESFYENGQEYVLLIDPKGYVEAPLALPVEIYKILGLIKPNMEFSDLLKSIKAHLRLDIEADVIIEILKGLNDQYLFESPNFYFVKYQKDHYNSQPVRPAVCAGNSYPFDATELEMELEKILSSVESRTVESGARFVIAPHIDFNIGRLSHEAYASAYHAIRGSNAELFVIFGTAHQKSSDMFMLSEKDFRTPLGDARTDNEIINIMKSEIPENLTIDEFAHRYEHSIELQVVLLQYLFKDRNFTILPVLTGSYYSEIMSKRQPNTSDRFYNFINALNKSIIKSGKRALFIASADLAHIGRKFQDNFDAESVLPQLRTEDMQLIDHIVRCNPESFFSSIAEVNDKRKICGLSPIYSLLESQRDENGHIPFNGKLLKYNQWNEVETRSGVTFASIAFYNSH
jgi:MEMO1 family protein